jgi:hypothetical protein
MERKLPEILQLPRIRDPRGNLTFAQSFDQLPFELKRAYWTYDVPGGEGRGGHSHREMSQVLIAVSGSFDVEVSDGYTWRTYTLNKPFEGLLLPPGLWSTLVNFSSGAVCLALASTDFAESDYVREYDEFVRLSQQMKPVFEKETGV